MSQHSTPLFLPLTPPPRWNHVHRSLAHEWSDWLYLQSPNAGDRSWSVTCESHGKGLRLGELLKHMTVCVNANITVLSEKKPCKTSTHLMISFVWYFRKWNESIVSKSVLMLGWRGRSRGGGEGKSTEGYRESSAGWRVGAPPWLVEWFLGCRFLSKLVIY